MVAQGRLVASVDCERTGVRANGVSAMSWLPTATSGGRDGKDAPQHSPLVASTARAPAWVHNRVGCVSWRRTFGRVAAVPRRTGRNRALYHDPCCKRT